VNIMSGGSFQTVKYCGMWGITWHHVIRTQPAQS
jgi:hypothetical protein